MGAKREEEGFLVTAFKSPSNLLSRDLKNQRGKVRYLQTEFT